jgi:hypothetical protein
MLSVLLDFPVSEIVLHTCHDRGADEAAIEFV